MATPEVLAPPPMYRLRPFFEIKKVKLPACMYLLKPVHQLPNLSFSAESSGSALSYLEKRQEWVLGQITNLQDRVKVLAQDLGVGPAEIGILQQATTSSTYQDVVISCPTSSPPYALLALYKYISASIPCTCKVHIHSSASSVATDENRRFFDGLSSCPNPKLKLTLVWKSESVCPYVTMIVSSHNQTPVEGIANIARYFCRQYSPDFYEDLGPIASSQIDSWLELVCGTLVRGTSKEKASVMRKLNSQLGSSSYLVGEFLSIADILSYSVICNLHGVKPSANVKQWLKRLQSSESCLGLIPFTCFDLI